MKDFVRVQSIDRAVAIIECFSGSKRELKLADITDKLELNKSTVHGILNTLKHHKFIEQDEITRKYRLGTRFIECSNLVVNSMDIINIACPVIEKICGKIEETVHIGMLDGLDVVFLDKRECCKSIRTTTQVGSRIKAYSTADGKIILCYLEKDKLKNSLPRTLKKFTPNTIDDKQLFLEELAIIKRNGYAVDYEETVQGLVGIAAPIYDYCGAVKYSIGATVPSIRINEDNIKEYIDIIRTAAMEISCRRGYKI